MARASRWLLIALATEKAIQRVVVSWVLASDRFDLRSAVAVDYRWLAVVGAVEGFLFAVALVGLVGRHRWSLVLPAILAAADSVGEFVAQGTLAISITLSLAVAVAVLVLSLHGLRRYLGPPPAQLRRS